MPLFWLGTLTGRFFLWSNLLLRPFTSSLLSHFLLEVIILWIKFSPTSLNFSLLRVAFLLLVYLTTCLCIWGRESGRRPLSLNARSSSPETRDPAKEPVWADFFFKCLGLTFSHLICHVNSSLETLTDIINLGLNTIMAERSTKVYETDRPWLSVQLKQLIVVRRHLHAGTSTYIRS